MLRGMGLRLRVAPSLDGIMDITIVIDLVPHGDAEEKGHAFAPALGSIAS